MRRLVRQFMYKYRYFLLLFCVLAVLLLWWYIPVCFDNNDDQTMLAINSGMLSGTPSANIILSNIFTGKILVMLFTAAGAINWYTVYIELALSCCFMLFAGIIIFHKNATPKMALYWMLFLFLGFFSWAIVKPQFTTVAILFTAASLSVYASNWPPKYKAAGVICLMSLALLIRKDAGPIFVLFSIPVFVRYRKVTSFRWVYGLSFTAVTIVFVCLQWVNNTNKTYLEQQTYRNVHALDIIAASPIKADSACLAANQFSMQDILLLQSWLTADSTYLSGKKIEQLAIALRTHRDATSFLYESRKFIADERYLILLYILSFISVVILVRSQRVFSGLNFLMALLLFSYLLFSLRLPHRVSFPVLTYLILSNVLLLLESDISPTKKTGILSVLLVLSAYKFYCVVQLGPLHTTYQHYYAACRTEINQHPDALFIGAEAFPLESMDAWESPVATVPAHNLILAGWYPCSPDFKTIMSAHRLTNLSIDLRRKKEVFFVTENKVLQQAYVAMMQERYNIKCHFEPTSGFRYLKAKRLVFDN